MGNLRHKGVAQVANSAHLVLIAGILIGNAGTLTDLSADPQAPFLDPQAAFHTVKHWLPPLTSQWHLELLYGSAGLIVGLWATQLALFCLRKKDDQGHISSRAVAGAAAIGLVTAVGSWAALSILSAQGFFGNSVGDTTFTLLAALPAGLSLLSLAINDSSSSSAGQTL